MNLKKQLIISLLLIGLIPLTVMSVISYFSASSAITKEAYAKLEAIKELKKIQLNTYISQLNNALEILADRNIVRNMFNELVTLHKKYEVEARGSFNITNKNDVKSVYSKYEPQFKDFMKKFDLYDVFMICKPHGHVMYTVAKESDLGANLKVGKLKDSALATVWQKVVDTGEPAFVDMAPYAPSNNEPAMFFGSPIKENGKMIGILAVQIGTDVINKIMTNRVGMGDTGETYLVGKDLLMRSDSYLDPINHSVKGSFKNPNLGRVDTEGVKEAFSGKTDTKIIIDYNGNPVLSSYTLIDIFGVKWGLLAEIDEAEVFIPIYELRNKALILSAIFLIIVIIVAIVLASFVSKPIVNAIRVISDGNSQIVSASTEISSSAQSLAEGATNQASSIEEISATVEQSTAINNQNAQNSKEADTLAKDTTISANNGNRKIESLMDRMKKISNSSDQIAKIIKTIDEIAFQTNLLALNAAVEAARAGEHGLGFAVVAEEVKTLANRSANAAKETTEIIEGSIEQIKAGDKIASETNEAFKEIVEKIQKTSHLIGEISISANEQAEGMNQIATAMGQIDEVTQQNAAVSEEAAAAAEELNAQAISMMDSVKEVAKIVGLDIENMHNETATRENKKSLIYKK